MQFDINEVLPLVINYGIKLIIAILVFLIGKWLSNRVCKVFVKIMEKNDVDQTLSAFLRNILYYVLLTAVIIAAAGQLGINTTSFLTVLGAASLAIGLALKDSLANFSSGVMLILFRPFGIGDVVSVAGETGKVQEITIFNTIINTADNKKKIIPNGVISNDTITNITANDTRRVDLVIGIGYDDDLKKAKETLTTIVMANKFVLADPAPVVAVSELADSSVNLVVRPWVKTDDYWTVYFELIETIKLTFDEEKISFPYPQQDVHLFKQDS